MKLLGSIAYVLITVLGGFFGFFSAVWYGYPTAYGIALISGAIVAALLYLHGPKKGQDAIRAFNIPAAMASFSIAGVAGLSAQPDLAHFLLGMAMCMLSIYVGMITQTSYLERREND